MRRASLLVLALLALIPAVAAADCVFVNANTSPNAVVAYRVETDGSLTLAAGSPFITAGSSEGRDILVVGDRLYATNSFTNAQSLFRAKGFGSPGSISGFAIQPSCSLVPLPGSPYPAGSSASGIAVNAARTRLWVGAFNSGNVNVYDIAGDGSLTEVIGSPFAATGNPLELELAAPGSPLVVAHNALGVGSYVVAADGSLTAAPGSPYADGAVSQLDINAAGTRVYLAERDSDGVLGYAIGAGGALTPLPGSPYAAAGAPSGVLLSPDETRLFVTQGLGGSVLVFTIAADGSLTPAGSAPTGFTSARGLTQSPDGSRLYALAAETEGGEPEVAGFAVSGTTLTPLPGSTYALGIVDSSATNLAYYAAGGLALSEIPTVGELGLALLTLLLAGVGGLALARRAGGG